MDIFSTDGPVYGFMVRLWDMVKLNFMWLLCSIPIVTMGAATTAAFYVTLKMVDEREGYICRTFWRAFRENLKQGSLMGCLMLAALYAIYLDVQLWVLQDSPLFLIILIFSAYIILFSFLYAYALLARYQNTVLNTLKNSFRIGMRYFLRTLFLLAVLALEIAAALWNSTTIFFGIIIGPACIFLTVSGMAMYLFRKIEQEPGAVSNPEKLQEERER